MDITHQEFDQFRNLLYELTGISLSAGKKALVCGRLAKRLRQRQLNSYGEYYRLLTSGHDRAEMQIAIDLLTTNETSFFREPKHFDFLRDELPLLHRLGRTLRVWSAASSTGEEAYSIAMVLAHRLGQQPWEVIGSDISARVVEKACSGHYITERAKNIPRQYLLDYCLKGIGAQAGTFLIDPKLRGRVRFMQHNLNTPPPHLGEIDVIFLRNVMIYFDMETKRQVVGRLLPLLRPGGYFIVGHSESLNGVANGLGLIKSSIYRKP